VRKENEYLVSLVDFLAPPFCPSKKDGKERLGIKDFPLQHSVIYIVSTKLAVISVNRIRN